MATALRDQGHRAIAVTLPGLESAPGDGQAGITIDDHIAALAGVVVQAGPETVLVAHSGAGAVVSGVLDRGPGAVRRVVYVDSGPSAAVSEPQPAAASTEVVPLPTWSELKAAGSSVAGLSDDDLATFAARAVPHPAGATATPRLANPGRHDVPTTIIACSIPSVTVAELAAAGHPMFAAVADLIAVEYVDLPTGHWPMWSRPADLAAALITAGQH